MTDDSKSHRGHSPPQVWELLKPLARQNRHEPTDGEERLWRAIRSRHIKAVKFRRQYAIERFIVDFCAVESHLVIEVDGPIHAYTEAEDGVRQEFIESQGFRVLRFTNEQVLQHIEDVLAAIAQAL